MGGGTDGWRGMKGACGHVTAREDGRQTSRKSLLCDRLLSEVGGERALSSAPFLRRL